jgi:hypothetical protein
MSASWRLRQEGLLIDSSGATQLTLTPIEGRLKSFASIPANQ